MKTQHSTETQHTPGPWRPYNLHRGRILAGWSVCDKRGCRIAKVEQMPGQSGEEEMANARLIASAPDLLAALEQAADGFALTAHNLSFHKEEKFQILFDCLRDMENQAREAIAKARGAA